MLVGVVHIRVAEDTLFVAGTAVLLREVHVVGGSAFKLVLNPTHGMFNNQ